MKREIEFGFCLPHSGKLARPSYLSELTQYAEKKGFAYLIEPSDHIVVPERIRENYPYSSSRKYTDTREDFEQLTEMTFVAAKTSKARILSAVTVFPYREPILLTKTLSTIDVLSNGRITIGVGTGWMRDEFEILRVPFKERGKITNEYIQIVRKLWSQKKVRFKGKYWSFPKVELLPKPVQKSLPIWIGGESPTAIKRAATLGDAWLPLGVNPRFPLVNASQMKSSLDYLKSIARLVKRKMNTFRVGYMVGEYSLRKVDLAKNKPFVGTPSKIVQQIRAFQEIGVSFFGISFLGDSIEDTKENVDRFFSEIVPSLMK